MNTIGLQDQSETKTVYHRWKECTKGPRAAIVEGPVTFVGPVQQWDPSGCHIGDQDRHPKICIRVRVRAFFVSSFPMKLGHIGRQANPKSSVGLSGECGFKV